MTKERWDDIVNTIRDSYAITNEGHQPLEHRPGTMDFVEFDGPVGKTRLELITTPVVTGTKGMGGHKVGAATAVRYEYSAEETAIKFLAYRWVDGEWQPIDASSFGT